MINIDRVDLTPSWDWVVRRRSLDFHVFVKSDKSDEECEDSRHNKDTFSPRR